MLSAGCNENSFESVIDKIFIADSLSNYYICDEFDPGLAKAFYFVVDNVVWKPELRNSVFKYPANFMLSLHFVLVLPCVIHLLCFAQSFHC